MDFQWIILFLVPLSPPLPEAPSIGTCESLDGGGGCSAIPFRPQLSPWPVWDSAFSALLWVNNQTTSCFSASKTLGYFLLSHFILTGECLLKTPLIRHTIFGSSDGKEYACNAGAPGSIPGWGRSLGEGNDNPLQYSCLENSIDSGAWWAAVHWVAKESDMTERITFTFSLFTVFL